MCVATSRVFSRYKEMCLHLARYSHGPLFTKSKCRIACESVTRTNIYDIQHIYLLHKVPNVTSEASFLRLLVATFHLPLSSKSFEDHKF